MDVFPTSLVSSCIGNLVPNQDLFVYFQVVFGSETDFGSSSIELTNEQAVLDVGKFLIDSSYPAIEIAANLDHCSGFWRGIFSFLASCLFVPMNLRPIWRWEFWRQSDN